MMTKKVKRQIFSFLIIALIGIISNILVRNTDVSTFSIFDTANLFSYFGVLIGFALTIYTFGLSMVSDIKEKIDKNERLELIQKGKIYQSLVEGFSQIKNDIWLIFYSILIVISFSIAKEVPNPFGFNVEVFKMPETVNLTLFITTTIAMWDIMQTLFNLSEINLELNKK
jgi:hypothetical protein